MNAQSRLANNGVAASHPLLLMEAEVQHDAVERCAATTGDIALVPTAAAERRQVTMEPSLNGLNGAISDQTSDNSCQPRDPKAFRDASGRFVKG